jgi:hypothetical protein
MSTDAIVTAVRQILAGVWDVYTPGMHSEVEFRADGSYTNTFGGGIQGHSGKWSLEWNYDAHIIRFTLESHYPEVYMGNPINWPATEGWLVTGILQNQIWMYGGMLIRHMPAGNFPGVPAFAAPLPQVSPQAPASPQAAASHPTPMPPAGPAFHPLPPMPPLQPLPMPHLLPPLPSVTTDISKMYAAAHQSGFDAIRRANENDRRAFENSNRAFMNYIKS